MADPSNPRTILCYGDSITWGFDAAGGTDYLRHSFTERWTRRLGAELGPDYHIVEEGLNGRTTVFDDPISGGKSGLADLPNTLQSHMPVSLLILMLGSNDLMTRFNLNAHEIARGLGRVIECASRSTCGPDSQAPKILVLIPPVVGTLAGPLVEPMYDAEKSVVVSRQLRQTYPAVAEQFGAQCLDTDQFAKSSTIDGLHLDRDMQQPFAMALASAVRGIFWP
ncbi:MAG: SGNH/GDSL hydrolase family protein [Alphaproteobacteria bacterium]|nr:SGNH/GDSL hydrolase family protein [Alphaproteobacteria bacterium]